MIVDPLNDVDGQKYVLAESGVDNEVGINAVQHDFHLAFTEENRSNAGSGFQIQLIEPNGLSLFSRIAYIARELRIKNHIHALYVLELKLIGWSDDPIPKPTEIYTQEWLTKCYSIQHSFVDNTSQYTLTLLETKEGVYDRIDFNFPMEIIVQASNLGEFATQLQTVINEAAKIRAKLDSSSILPTEFEFEVPDKWKNWGFATVINDSDGGGRGVSITGANGGLKFVFPAGTQITHMLAEASYATENFRKIPTTLDGAAGENLAVSAKELANIINWISFAVNVEFIKFDRLANRYQRKLTFKMIPYAATQAIIDRDSHDELINNEGLQKIRLARTFKLGLLQKRFDYYLTGKNTEVLDLSIEFNTAYNVMQPLYRGITVNPADTLPNSGNPGGDRDSQSLAQKVAELTRQIQDLERRSETGFVFEQNRSDIINLTLERDRLYQESTVLNDALNGARPDSGTGGRDGDIKYITQEDINEGEDPTSYVTFNNYSIENNGQDESNTNDASKFQARLGALKLNLNSMFDMMTINISVRGDPYWLAKEGTFDNGGPLFFLNVNFPTYSAEGEYTATTNKDLNLAGLYNVTKVTSQYQNGQFIMTLLAHRNLPTNTGLIYEQLAAGDITEADAELAFRSLDVRSVSIAGGPRAKRG
tara:strand:- start:7608 stop:9557 length:1950 start_codon:yes stop_codon:yes gene_type:complete